MKDESGKPAVPGQLEGVTRRKFLEWGMGAGGLLLSGESLAAAAADTPAAAAKGRPAPRLENELVFACNGGGTQKAFEEHLFPEFSKRYGVTKFTYVAGQPANNVAKLRAQKNNPAIDVIWLAGGITFQAMEENLVADLDRALIPNLQLTAPTLVAEKAAAVIGVTICGLLHNIDVYKKRGFAPPTSWWDMWDPKLKGHVGCYSINVTSTTAFLIKLSMELTGEARLA